MRRTILIAAAVALMAAGGLGAQVADMPEIYKSFAVSGDYLRIYPEAAYGVNPANILQLRRPVLITYLDLTGMGTETVLQHPTGWTGAGAAGGTWEQLARTCLDVVALDGLFPLGSDMSAGFGAFAGLLFEKDRDHRVNYFSNPENILIEEEGGAQIYAADGYFAYRAGSLGLGVRAGLYGAHDPHTAVYTTDANANSGVRYISAFADDERDLTWMPRVNLGAVYQKGPLWAGLGVGGSYSSTSTTPFAAVDQDANGFDDTVVTDAQWSTTTEAWGRPGGPYPEYAYMNSDTEVTVSLYPAAIYELSPTFAVFATGYWDLYDARTTISYEHLMATDRSQNRLDYRYTYFGATAGVIWQPSARLRLRAGAGYGGDGFRQTNNSLDPAGVSVFDPLNTNHYAEANLGAAPDNDGVIVQVNPGNDTFRSYTHKLLGLFAFEYMPAGNVLLFNTVDAGLSSRVETYNVFNTADDTVWEERAIAGVFDLTYEILLGVGVFVRENLFVGVEAGGGTLGSLSARDQAPSGPAAPGAGADYTTRNEIFSLSVSAFCVIGL